MTAHWIDVKDGQWALRSEMVGFKALSGEHSGENLGRYFVGLCERVGIIAQKRSKVKNYGINPLSVCPHGRNIPSSIRSLLIMHPIMPQPARRLNTYTKSEAFQNGIAMKINYR
jgi:hypothetical protein